MIPIIATPYFCCKAAAARRMISIASDIGWRLACRQIANFLASAFSRDSSFLVSLLFLESVLARREAHPTAEVGHSAAKQFAGQNLVHAPVPHNCWIVIDHNMIALTSQHDDIRIGRRLHHQRAMRGGDPGVRENVAQDNS
ncbi:MAG: hypothetical protein U0232_14585 [Thermomicrobiales bacterium]